MRGIAGATLATRLATSAQPSLVLLGIFWATAAEIPLMAIDANFYLLGGLLGVATLLAPAAGMAAVALCGGGGQGDAAILRSL